MKDFTPQQAKKWVEQEQAKHQSVDSIRKRIAEEQQMMGLAAKMPGMPNSAAAHKELHDMLEARLAALQASQA